MNEKLQPISCHRNGRERDYSLSEEELMEIRQQSKYGNPQPQSYKPLQDSQVSHAVPFQRLHIRRLQEQVCHQL